MSNFIITDRKTDYLLPPSVDDWLNEDHLARFVVEVIDQLRFDSLLEHEVAAQVEEEIVERARVLCVHH